jgi:transposase-like protein
MSKSAILNYAKAAVETQNNSDRLAAFLEMNKPKKFSKRELGMALNLSVPAIAITLKDQPNISTSGDNPLRYFWGVNPKADDADKLVVSNPLCPECGGDSVRRGKSHVNKYRYRCKVCKTGFNVDTALKPIAEQDQAEYTKLLDSCRRKTFYAVREFRKGAISESTAKRIAKKAFPDISALPTTRSLIQNARLLRVKVCRAALSVDDASITEAIAHLISYLAFPDGED